MPIGSQVLLILHYTEYWTHTCTDDEVREFVEAQMLLLPYHYMSMQRCCGYIHVESNKRAVCCELKISCVVTN